MKTALITGSTSGIGKAAAFQLAKDGYEVLIHGRDGAKGAEVVAAIEKAGGSASFFRADLKDRQAVTDLFKQIQEKYSSLDILVNNAGGEVDNDDFVKASEEDIIDGFKRNFFSAVYCTQETRKMMDKGVIVNVGSVCGLEATPTGGGYTVPFYSAAKAALHNFGQNLAKVAAPDIRVNTVVPGYTSTPNWGNPDELAADEKKLGIEPLIGRFSTAEEVADVIMLLIKNQAMTGSLVTVDGGLTISEVRA